MRKPLRTVALIPLVTSVILAKQKGTVTTLSLLPVLKSALPA